MKKVDYEDVNNALRDTTRFISTYRLKDTNEHVMSISVPLKNKQSNRRSYKI